MMRGTVMNAALTSFLRPGPRPATLLRRLTVSASAAVFLTMAGAQEPEAIPPLPLPLPPPVAAGTGLPATRPASLPRFESLTRLVIPGQVPGFAAEPRVRPGIVRETLPGTMGGHFYFVDRIAPGYPGAGTEVCVGFTIPLEEVMAKHRARQTGRPTGK